ncbi:MAG: hypothetical protein GX678_04140 [Actinomycetales bacterium]|nr:hypothetical protein [Actinomycetales bacterium]
MLPSATANDTAHELSALEVDETIADFAQAARNAIEAGFDGEARSVNDSV